MKEIRQLIKKVGKIKNTLDKGKETG